MGHEVAEFGFYEDRHDAMVRYNDLVGKINMPGTLDIREISVNRSSQSVSEQCGTAQTEVNYYQLKEKEKS
jgi:hypothetical protein